MTSHGVWRGDGQQSRREAEHLRPLKASVDFTVLARYTQILSMSFIGPGGAPGTSTK